MFKAGLIGAMAFSSRSKKRFMPLALLLLLTGGCAYFSQPETPAALQTRMQAAFNEKRYPEAAEYARQLLAADPANGEAKKTLGMAYCEQGKACGDRKELDKALEFFRQADSVGDPSAGLYMYCIYTARNNDAEAEKNLLMAAEKGCAEAQYLLGIINLFGHDCGDREWVEAMRWFRKAAEQDHVEAQSVMGKLCFDSKNYAEAVIWYYPLAAKGDKEARQQLYKCLELTRGAGQDKIASEKFIREEQENAKNRSRNNLEGVSDAINLGLLLFRGIPMFSGASPQIEKE